MRVSLFKAVIGNTTFFVSFNDNWEHTNKKKKRTLCILGNRSLSME